MDQLKTSIEHFTSCMKTGNYSSTIVMNAIMCGLTLSREERPMYLDKVSELAQQGMSESELRQAITKTTAEFLGIAE